MYPKYLLRFVVLLTIFAVHCAPAFAGSMRSGDVDLVAFSAAPGVPADVTLVELDAGAAPNVGPTVLPDPVQDPGGFLREARALWAKGWPIAVVTILFVVMGAAKARVAALRKPGTRLAAGWTGGMMVLSTVALVITGVVGWAELSSVVAIAVALVINPLAKLPEQGATK